MLRGYYRILGFEPFLSTFKVSRKKLKPELPYKEDTTNMYSLEQLNTMKGAGLKDILREKKLTMSGTKTALIQRIWDFQQSEIKAQQEHEIMLTHGAQVYSPVFEKIMGAFQQWCKQEKFQVNKYGNTPCTFEVVDINEIRYKMRTITSLEEFYHEFFNTFLDSEWYLFSEDGHDDREFDCDSQYNDEWMIKGMNEIFERA